MPTKKSSKKKVKKAQVKPHYVLGFFIALVGGALILTAAWRNMVSASSTLIPSSQLPAKTTSQTLTYCTTDKVAYKMDFYRPSGTANVPVVLHVHGGGWVLGDRAWYAKAATVSALLNKGIAYATIDYKLSDAPAASQNVACAVRYLRAQAKTLHLTGKVGALGDSAGGQLVSLLGVTDAFSAGTQYPTQSSKLQAVADEWGPVIFDTTQIGLLNGPIAFSFKTTDPNALKAYSPLSYLSRDDPPFLIIQGADDATVPASQSVNFALALQKAGISNRLVVVPGAGHYLNAVEGKTKSTNPALDEVTNITNFFVTNLK